MKDLEKKEERKILIFILAFIILDLVVGIIISNVLYQRNINKYSNIIIESCEYLDQLSNDVIVDGDFIRENIPKDVNFILSSKDGENSLELSVPIDNKYDVSMTFELCENYTIIKKSPDINDTQYVNNAIKELFGNGISNIIIMTEVIMIIVESAILAGYCLYKSLRKTK